MNRTQKLLEVARWVYPHHTWTSTLEGRVGCNQSLPWEESDWEYFDLTDRKTRQDTLLMVDRGVLVAWPHKLGVRIYRLPGVRKNIFKLRELENLDMSEVLSAAAGLSGCHGLKRRIAKRKRTPIWSDKYEIEEIYQTAKRISLNTGIKHEVDHIIPLQGELVSGLHVPENLQIIPKRENRKKRNKYTP